MNAKKDYWVDGHFVAAYSAADALREVKRLLDHDAEIVRPWTDADNEPELEA